MAEGNTPLAAEAIDLNQNQGYKIIKSVEIRNEGRIVLGHNPKAPSPYVTWVQFTEERGFTWGHYFLRENSAWTDFLRRVVSEEMSLDFSMDAVEIDGHTGTWYLIDTASHNGTVYYLWESEIYGEDAGHIITDGTMNVIIDEAYNKIKLELEEYFDSITPYPKKDDIVETSPAEYRPVAAGEAEEATYPCRDVFDDCRSVPDEYRNER